MGKYDDILFEAPPASTRHSRMKRSERAKQFAPFAALKGYEEAVKAQEQQFSPPLLLSESRKAEINRILCQAQAGDMVCLDYYHRGSYHSVCKPLLKIDQNRRVLLFEKLSVPIDTIKEIALEGVSLPEEGC